MSEAATAAAMYSYVNMILLSVIGGAFAIFLLLGAWWGKYVHTKLGEASSAAKAIEKWAEAHDKQDDERHLESKERANGIHKSVHDLRDQVSNFALRMGVQQKTRV